MTRKALLAITVLVVAGTAVAAQAASRSITLKSQSANGVSTKVLAAPNGRTLYRLNPETSRHLLCSSAQCLKFWPPLTVKSKTTKVKLPAGVKGKIAYLKRGKRFQVTLKGRPLYVFSGDSAAGQASGQNIKGFGGTWMVLPTTTNASAPVTPYVAPPQTMTTTTSTTTTTTPGPYGY
jgi:predicted lipoprotein with Yx(FWY)xxD motif